MPKPRYKIWMHPPSPFRLGASLLRFLREHFDIVLDPDEPDLVFFTRSAPEAGYKLRPRVFFDAQQTPAWPERLMDWELGYLRERAPASWQHYMPNWLFLDCAKLSAAPENAHSLMREKRHFCVFLHHRAYPVRNTFYDLLSARRSVDALGFMFRNRPPPAGLGTNTHPDRLLQLPPVYRHYKFVVCFENVSYPGYLTEKLICALLARAVPIYWGDPLVHKQINPACFINAHDFASPQDLAAYVLKVDADDALYRQYLSAPVFLSEQLPDCARWDVLRDQLHIWLQQSRQPQFQPQGQKGFFLRELWSRLNAGSSAAVLPTRIAKDAQKWSDPQRIRNKSARRALASSNKSNSSQLAVWREAEIQRMQARTRAPVLRLWIADASSNLQADDLPAHPIIFEAQFLRFLQRHFALQLDRDNPTLLFHNNRLTTAPQYLCPHVFVSEENVRPPPHKPCEGRIGYAAADNGACLYLPNWALMDCAPLLAAPENPQRLLGEKKHFCVFIHEMMRPGRPDFFELLSRYRRVDSLGDLMRNRPTPPRLHPRHRIHDWDTLPAAYRAYKFALTFENSAYPGYLTEKLLYALMARTVPIYWGDPEAVRFFDPRCFVHARDFASPQKLADYILELDGDDARYCAYLSAPIFRDNRLPDCARWDNIALRLRQVLSQAQAHAGRSHAECSAFQRESVSRLAAAPVLAILPLHKNRRARQTAPWGRALPGPNSEVRALPPGMDPEA